MRHCICCCRCERAWPSIVAVPGEPGSLWSAVPRPSVPWPSNSQIFGVA